MPGERSDHLTQTQLDKLRAELAVLEGPKRAAAVEAIARAREFGDLSENFEYHAAKNEQGLLESRIAILRARLGDAVVVETGGSDTVGPTSNMAMVAAGASSLRMRAYAAPVGPLPTMATSTAWGSRVT